MKIIFPFWAIAKSSDNLFLYDRYYPQINAIAKEVDKLHLVYVGDDIDHLNWHDSVVFHKVEGHQQKRSNISMLNRPYFSRKRLLKRILSKCKNIDIDLVYTFCDGYFSHVGYYLSKRLKVPHVIRLRGDHIETDKARYKAIGLNRNIRIGRKIRDVLLIRNYKKANLIIPISIQLKEKAINWCGNSYRITNPVPNGVDPSIRLLKNNPDVKDKNYDLIIGYAGRINYEKQVDRLIEIINKIKNIQLLIAGDWQIKKYNLPPNAKYLGHLKQIDMPNFYNRVDLITLLSATEGFPNVILESYSSGTPVLCYENIFPFKDVKLFGYISSIEAFPETISKIINGKNELKDIGSNARNYVTNKFTWDEYGKKMIELLNRV